MTTAKEHREAIAPSALDLALAMVIANCRKEFAAELELLRTERRAIVAELKHDIAMFKVAALEAKASRSAKT